MGSTPKRPNCRPAGTSEDPSILGLKATGHQKGVRTEIADCMLGKKREREGVAAARAPDGRGGALAREGAPPTSEALQISASDVRHWTSRWQRHKEASLIDENRAVGQNTSRHLHLDVARQGIPRSGAPGQRRVGPGQQSPRPYILKRVW
jgi:hypothetical protein